MIDDRTAEHAPVDVRLTQAEAWAAALVAGLAAAVVVPFLADLAGFPFPPWPMLAVTVATTLASLAVFSRQAVPASSQWRLWVAVVVALGTWLVWLARPSFLPISTGPDLTHHLQLIRYLETHWRLVHDPSVERFLGEMTQYTPGSQLLAAFAGAWSGTDGLRALHALLAVTVALKAGLLLLIASRLVGNGASRLPLALCSVLLLFAAPRYFLGSLTEYAFVAQVVAELFVVGLWWIAVAWDARPRLLLAALFSAAGAAAFLTWPVYTGPPALAFFLVVVLQSSLPRAERVRHLLAAYVPFGFIALVYLAGRLGWLQMAGTSGDAPWPTIASYGWPLVALAACGLLVARTTRRARATVLLAASVLAQSGAFYVLARRSGAAQPYMALKMFYLLLWPMSALATLSLAAGWHAAERALTLALTRTPALGGRLVSPGARRAAAWTVTLIVAVLVFRPLARAPRLLHPRPPAVSAPLYDAGRWARTHLPAGCVEYLVGDDESAYWLHLAVLGNPRMSARTGDNDTYELNPALLRWLTPNGLPYAIVDLTVMPRDVREELDLLVTFDTAAVARRRGPASCADEGR